ncbi:MAG: hypothetical protein DRH10_09420 [Deltaproteobacteria bacterium]|nr:MAG: hypothetical protein DRH10_09420 [Deltaproteobacteria bacterium]
MIFKVLDVLPGSQMWIYCFKIDDGKSAVGGIRKERQDMKCVNRSFEIGLTEPGERGQWRGLRAPEEIAIGDQNDVFFCKTVCMAEFSLGADHFRGLVGIINHHDPLEFREIALSRVFAIKKSKPAEKAFSLSF